MVHLTLLSRTLRGLDQSLINGPPDTFSRTSRHIHLTLLSRTLRGLDQSLINGPPDTFVSYIAWFRSVAD